MLQANYHTHHIRQIPNYLIVQIITTLTIKTFNNHINNSQHQ